MRLPQVGSSGDIVAVASRVGYGSAVRPEFGWTPSASGPVEAETSSSLSTTNVERRAQIWSGVSAEQRNKLMTSAIILSWSPVCDFE